MKKRISLFSSAVMAIQLLLASTWGYAAEFQEIKQSYQNLTVNAKLMMADDKTFANPMVLLTHGTLTHNERSTYQQLQKNLANQGISSLAINLSLGLNDRKGEYDCASPHTHKHTDALKEIDFWLKWLTSKGTTKVTLMGHSRGGNQTAWYAAEQDSDLIKNIVLIAPATGEQQSASDYERKYGKPLAKVLAKAKALIAKNQGDAMLKETDFIYCKKAQVTASAFVDYYESKPQFDTPTLLEKISKPTLVIMGTNDTVVADLPEKIQPLAEADKIQTLMLEDADHFFLDFANEDIASATAEFMSGTD
ncbi:alpha/beta hydrolase [Hydrogenovibrio sp. SC-1]|uniref:alpha/beta hydrolase n=1 Tax=Hydrogenovibrio sp. SC-1 TaxID=2065820 RepID=UPI000C7B4A60|nr:alpha/beta hydrolase [Hydrogenovibrio sp. SC-1]PLA75048.1 alpha/beta hydrolase [Hydrogenovibrio sp. SC-1]